MEVLKQNLNDIKKCVSTLEWNCYRVGLKDPALAGKLLAVTYRMNKLILEGHELLNGDDNTTK